MAYRGRGGGRGGYGHAHYATNQPFVPFPDIHLPDARGILSDLDQKKNKGLNEEETLIKETLNWLMKSQYNLDQTDKQGKDVEISERTKQNAKRKIDSFSQYLVPSMFPKELTRGSNVQQLSREKVQWDREKKAEIDWAQFEKLEQNQDAKKKKEGEKDEEEEEDNEEDEEEDGDPSDDDYVQNEYFDDDDDDFNPEDDGADEPLLD